MSRLLAAGCGCLELLDASQLHRVSGHLHARAAAGELAGARKQAALVLLWVLLLHLGLRLHGLRAGHPGAEAVAEAILAVI